MNEVTLFFIVFWVAGVLWWILELLMIGILASILLNLLRK